MVVNDCTWIKVLFPKLKKTFDDYSNGKFWSWLDDNGEELEEPEWVEIEFPINYTPLFK